jgi:predicted alpha/beta-fold hydrolase
MTPFKPAWWLRNPHLQTLWSTLFRWSGKLPLQRERFELLDGDFIDLDWVGAAQGPIVLILHGLEGSAKSPYAYGMLKALHQQGWRAAVMHFRSCSGEPNRLLRSYHSGETGDVAAIVQLLQLREPQTPIAAMGFSLGGNVLLKWLGETGQNNPLVAAVAISVPFELAKSAARLQIGFSRLYEWHLMQCLRRKMAQKLQSRLAHKHFPPLGKLRTIAEFDDKVTAPLHGFTDGHDYYYQSSSRQFLCHIQVPTLILHAKDDPFMTVDVIPGPQELSAAVQIEMSENGGHVGFIAGDYPWRPQYWLEQRIPLFLNQYLPGKVPVCDDVIPASFS